MQDDAGLWHLSYTDTSKAEDGLYQRIGHAASSALHNWTRVGDGLALDLAGPHAAAYEVEHIRGFWHDRRCATPG